MMLFAVIMFQHVAHHSPEAKVCHNVCVSWQASQFAHDHHYDQHHLFEHLYLVITKHHVPEFDKRMVKIDAYHNCNWILRFLDLRIDCTCIITENKFKKQF